MSFMKKLLLFFTMFLMISTKAQIPTDSLVAYYPIISDSDDYSGNGNHMTLSGTDFVNDRLGNEGQAVFFDGTGDYAIMNDTAFDFQYQFSLSFWMRTSSTTPDQRIFHKNDPIPDRSWFLSLNRSTTGALTFLHSQNGSTFKNIISDSLFNDGKWNHVVLVYDGANQTVRFYKNGNLAGEDTTAYTSLHLNNDNMTMTNSNFQNNFAQGVFDDIRFYKKVLDTADVTELSKEKLPSAITELDETIFKIYPNPADDYVLIESVQSTPGIDKVELYDLNFSLIHSAVIEPDKLKVNINNLKQGVYLIRLTNSNSKMSVIKKLIVI